MAAYLRGPSPGDVKLRHPLAGHLYSVKERHTQQVELAFAVIQALVVDLKAFPLNRRYPASFFSSKDLFKLRRDT
jgi:hypothetical protein